MSASEHQAIEYDEFLFNNRFRLTPELTAKLSKYYPRRCRIIVNFHSILWGSKTVFH